MVAAMDIGVNAGPSPARPAAISARTIRNLPLGLRLRAREISDSETLFHLFNQPLCRHGLVTEPFASSEDFARRLPPHRPNTVEIVATLRDVAIGYAGVFPGFEARSHVGEISVFVHDNFHGLGVGALLVGSVIAAAETLLRLDRLELVVRAGNDSAIALYGRFGFVEEGRHHGFARLDGIDIDVISMARRRARDSSLQFRSS